MKKFLLRLLLVFLSLALFYFLWKALIYYFDYPSYILPSPDLVQKKLLDFFVSGKIYPHLQRTFLELIWGFIFGFLIASISGYLLAKKKLLKITFTPYIVAFQAVPIVALAPLIILWFGNGLLSKIIISGLVVFFPVFVNTLTAVNSIDPELKDLFHIYRANSLQTFFKLELPASANYIFASLKIGIILSLVGAIVGEFVGADKGLGFLINSSLGLIDTPQLFAVIFILSVIGIFLYLIALSLEKIFNYN